MSCRYLWLWTWYAFVCVASFHDSWLRSRTRQSSDTSCVGFAAIAWRLSKPSERPPPLHIWHQGVGPSVPERRSREWQPRGFHPDVIVNAISAMAALDWAGGNKYPRRHFVYGENGCSPTSEIHVDPAGQNVTRIELKGRPVLNRVRSKVSPLRILRLVGTL